MNIIKGDFGTKACADLSAELRKLADKVDAGEIVDFVAAFVDKNNYCFYFSASLDSSVVLATLLSTTAVDNMRKPEL